MYVVRLDRDHRGNIYQNPSKRKEKYKRNRKHHLLGQGLPGPRSRSRQKCGVVLVFIFSFLGGFDWFFHMLPACDHSRRIPQGQQVRHWIHTRFESQTCQYYSHAGKQKNLMIEVILKTPDTWIFQIWVSNRSSYIYIYILMYVFSLRYVVAFDTYF